MKKILAMLLALALVLVNVAALAENGDNDTNPPENQTTGGDTNTESNTPEAPAGDTATGTKGHTYFYKTYTVDGNVNDILPNQALQFEVSVPTGVTNPDDSMITVAADGYTVDKLAENQIDFTLPTYTKTGLYKYIIKEKTTNVASSINSTKAMTYSTDEVKVDVYVTYNNDGEIVATPVVYVTNVETKDDTITNTYEVGSIKVGKSISGSLANASKLFKIEVNLTSDNGQVWSDITLVPGTGVTATVDTGTTAATSIVGDGWTTKNITIITPVDGEIDIQDIPVGVKYTISETGIGDTAENMTTLKHIEQDANTQMANVNDDTAYYVTNEVAASDNKMIAKGENDKVTINNYKDVTIPTGIELDTIPYILILAVAMMGAVVLASRKRREE